MLAARDVVVKSRLLPINSMRAITQVSRPQVALARVLFEHITLLSWFLNASEASLLTIWYLDGTLCWSSHPILGFSYSLSHLVYSVFSLVFASVIDRTECSSADDALLTMRCSVVDHIAMIGFCLLKRPLVWKVLQHM